MSETPELSPDGENGGEEVKLTKEEFDELVKASAESKQALTNVVNEIKEMRQINADLKKKVEESEVPPTDVQKAVEQELAKREKTTVEELYKQVSEGFLTAHPEFSQEQDPGGVKLSAFQKALGRINLIGIKTKEGFEEAFSDAIGLMERKYNPETVKDLPPSPKGGGALPRVAPNHNLPSAEEKLVKSHFGGNVEEYLKAKAKKPAYFEELLKWAR